MVRVKQAFSSESVQLHLYGPKSILPRSIKLEAKLTHTWYQILIAELGLEITPESGLFICSSNYTPTQPQQGVGWRSELHEQVGEFVRKFERNRKVFLARLCYTDAYIRSFNDTGNVDPLGVIRNLPISDTPKGRVNHPALESRAGPNSQFSNSNQTAPPARNIQRQTQTPKQLKRQRELTLSLSEINLNGHQNKTPKITNVTSLQKKRGQSEISQPLPPVENVRAEPSGQPVWDMFWNDYPEERQENYGDTSGDSGQGDGMMDEDDNASLCTAATQEEIELNREGIQVEDIKSFVEGRMSRFSNAFILRVREEIRKLRQNNLWDRNVHRSPLACYLLQEIF